MLEIKRSIELYLAAQLSAIDVNLPFYASKGDEAQKAQAIEPPFGVVVIDKAEEILSHSNAYLISGAAMVVSAMDDTGVSLHSGWVTSMKDILDTIASRCQGGGISPAGYNFMFHGMDIGGIQSKDSPEDRANGDAIAFTIGATQLSALTPLPILPVVVDDFGTEVSDDNGTVVSDDN